MANIRGNDDDNRLNGTNLVDRIWGMSGDDTINGYNGADTIDGGEGNDRVYSTVSFTLSDNVERLSLLGEEWLNATGNDVVTVEAAGGHPPYPAGHPLGESAQGRPDLGDQTRHDQCPPPAVSFSGAFCCHSA
mgnify:CR=1 FL=1